MTEIKLKPCPFCGKKPKTLTSEFGKRHNIECRNPDCHCTVFASGTTKEEAAVKWNRRAGDENS